MSNIVVTGGSRDIGGGIVLELAKTGANVLSIFRSKPERAQKIADEIKIAGGKAPVLLQADLTTTEGRDLVFANWKDKFDNQIDVLVLCASGATMEINVDANMALVDKFLEVRQARLKKGDKLTPGTIIFLQSEPGHYHRVIDGVFDFIAYYRDKVGPAKRAGEDALKKRLSKAEEAGVRAIVVCPPEVTDTFNMKLFELQNKEARAKSRELSAMLGTKDFVTIVQVAARVRELIENKNIRNGHIELFDNIKDGLTYLSMIYGEEAIYVHTYEKTGEGSGVGRMIVNPKLWMRNAEPPFTGEIKNKSKNQLETSLEITKGHTRGHFREDIASLFPGHKSIRSASVALGRFLNKDFSVNPDQIFLRKYTSVKFRSPVLPGQILNSKVTLTKNDKNSVSGDGIQTVQDKESMDIRGMVVERLSENNASALLLDQLIETAAQTVGMYVLESLNDEQVLPLFHSTGEAQIFKNVLPGDNLLIKASKAKIVKAGVMNIFSADLDIVKKGKNEEEIIASIKSVSGLLLPREEVLKKINNN